MSDATYTVPATMSAVEIVRPGGPDVLVPAVRSVPVPAAGELLIRVHAAGVNGPDVLQRKGVYDPPPGASDLPGLEVAGEVVALGEGVTRFSVGDRVCALIPGGGYAEYATAHESNTLFIPEGLSVVEAAAMPETFMTVWLNVFQRGRLAKGETVLIHGGTSGIGTATTMFAKALGAGYIITTVGSAQQQAASIALGADLAIDYRREDFVEKTMEFTGGKGADVVVDIIAGDYVARNYAVAAMNGRIVQIGVMKGPASQVDLFPMLAKRLTHIGSTLRSRTHEEKAEIIGALEKHIWPHVRSGDVKPMIYRRFQLERAADAHALLESGGHVGKIVLTTAAVDAMAD